MIDNGKYTIHYRSPGEIEKVLLNPSISFDRIATNSHTGEKIHLHQFRNLTLGVNYRLCKINVTGSLTTFSKGNNYTNLSFAELVEVLTVMCQTLHKEPHEITVHRFEYSIIIKTPLQPCTYIGHLLSYKKKEFYKQIPPAWSAKPLLSFCGLQQFIIKFYDCAKWHKLPSVKLLKYEIKFTRSEKALSILKKKGVLTFADLLVEDNLQAFGSFAIDTYRTIDTDVTISSTRYRKLTTKQRRLIFAGERPDFWKLERSVNRNTYKKDRKLYLNLKRQIKDLEDNVMKDLEEKIVNQVNALTRGKKQPPF